MHWLEKTLLPETSAEPSLATVTELPRAEPPVSVRPQLVVVGGTGVQAGEEGAAPKRVGAHRAAAG